MISIVIPYIRPENMPKLIDLIIKNAGMPSNEYEVVSKCDIDRIGCPRMVKELVGKTKGDMVCFLGDDTVPERNFLKNASDAMRYFKDNWGVVGLNDLTGRNLPTHWLAHKKILPLIGGEFFHTGYKHCYCDNELWERSASLGRYIYCMNSIVRHNNPMLDNKIKADADYKRVYSESYVKHDKDLFFKRRTNEWQS